MPENIRDVDSTSKKIYWEPEPAEETRHPEEAPYVSLGDWHQYGGDVVRSGTNTAMPHLVPQVGDCCPVECSFGQQQFYCQPCLLQSCSLWNITASWWICCSQLSEKIRRSSKYTDTPTRS